MNKTELKKFAAIFRASLAQTFKRQLQLFNLDPVVAQSSIVDSSAYQAQLIPSSDIDALSRALRSLTPSRVLEIATFTWFNRLVALRFMELRALLPPENPLPWQSRACLLNSTHQLSNQLPQIFSGPTYLDLFLPDDDTFSALLQPLLTLRSQNFQSIETIGWLYQYYQQSARRTPADPSLTITVATRPNSRRPYSKYEVPAATQLFTPSWIVKFLVENSLGRWWLDHGGDASLARNWQFLVNQPQDYSQNAPHRNPDPTTIKIFDPCCGSGHILVYAFTVLEQLYLAAGFASQDIPELILRHNLYGLDLDSRAAELATLAVLLRARLSDPNILHRPIAHDWRCYSFPDPAVFPRGLLNSLPSSTSQSPSPSLRDQGHALFEQFTLGQDVGSLLLPSTTDFSALATTLSTDFATSPLSHYLAPYLTVHQLLSAHYDFVITNPPYLSTALMNQPLKNYLKDNFTDFKADTFAAFIYRSTLWLKPQGSLAIMTPSNWLHATTFQPLRQFILKHLQLNTLVQPASGSFFSEAAVDICASVFRFPSSSNQSNQPATTFLSIRPKTSMPEQGQLLQQFLGRKETSPAITSVRCVQRPLSDFASLPRQAFLYQLPARATQLLRSAPKLSDFAPPCQGIITGNNHRYLRYWFEPEPTTLGTKWLPHNKGGGYRKWYGNREFVIDWEAQITAQKHIPADKPHKSTQRHSRLANLDKNFQPSLSWSAVTSSDLSVRYYDEHFTFNSAAPSCFPAAKNRLYLLGLLNSVVAQSFARALNPSLNLNPGDLANLPVIINESIRPQVESLAQANLDLVKADYNDQETSPDFTAHPLLQLTPSNPQATLPELCETYQNLCRTRQQTLQANETTLNQLFLTSFHLTAELDPQVQLSTLSIPVPTISVISHTFLSYIIGCALGRFQPPQSLSARIPQNPPNPSSPLRTIPDLLSYLEHFLSAFSGPSQLTANLDFLASHLAPAYHEPPQITIARYLAKQFFTDHAHTYHHCPIYWQFTSGPAHAFDAFLYVHRYQPSVSHPDSTPSTLSSLQSLVSTTPPTPITARLTPTRRARAEQELQSYLTKLTPLVAAPPRLNFDLGVLANYARLQPLLAKLPRRRSS